MLKRFGLTILLTVIGGMLGLALAIAFVWDWFGSSWQAVEASPEPVAALVHIERDQVWVESESGVLYKYTDAERCRSDCWTVVNTPPDPVWHDDPDLMDVKDSLCSPALPLSRIAERIEQCRVETWVNRNYVFALRTDGSLYFWQSEVYGEWLVVELMLGLGGGTACLCVPSVLFLLVPSSIRWLRKRSVK